MTERDPNFKKPIQRGNHPQRPTSGEFRQALSSLLLTIVRLGRGYKDLRKPAAGLRHRMLRCVFADSTNGAAGAWVRWAAT